MLRTKVDYRVHGPPAPRRIQPTIVAVHSAPEESILAVRLIGGIDRATGDLAGFALQRVWT